MLTTVPSLETIAAGADIAPWWGVPVIAGLFLVLGAFLGFFFNRATENRRTKREDKQRFDDKVLEFSIDLVATSQDITLAARRLSSQLKTESREEIVQTRLKISELVRHVLYLNGALYIVAPTIVSSYAQELTNCATATFSATSAEILIAAGRQNSALSDFIKQLRYSIGRDTQLQNRDPESN